MVIFLKAATSKLIEKSFAQITRTMATVVNRVANRAMSECLSLISLKAILVSILYLTPQLSQAIDLPKFLVDLKSTGVEVEVHGIDTESDRYVVTYRGQGFFDFQHFALTSIDPKINLAIKDLHRHDRIFIKGDIPALKRPFLHIEATELKMVKPYGHDLGKYTHPVKIPDDIIGKSSIRVKVHATHDDGKMLVADYLGSVLPILVPASLRAVAKNLDRGDMIDIIFAIALQPTTPVHLELKDEPKAIVAVDHMSDLHGKPVTYTGSLVLFLESPQVQFNVFALQLDLGAGFVREYTILNFEDPALFKQLREKMQKAWDAADQIKPENDRNKLIKRKLQMTATGVFNFVDRGQANPQILISDLADISFLVVP
jgi:hypothetical protein